MATNNTDQTILSILIASIPERKEKLEKLKKELHRQIGALHESKTLGNIEIIIDDSKSFLNGGLSIGLKREKLKNTATGKYLLFLDEDEDIAPNYIETLLRLCNMDADICTFRALFKLKDYWGLVDMRFAYKVNDQATPEHTIRRPPWHICPVRREFAQLYSFEDKNNAEDYAWMEKVLAHCTTEAHSDRILFQYNHGDESEADKIENLKQ